MANKTKTDQKGKKRLERIQFPKNWTPDQIAEYIRNKGKELREKREQEEGKHKDKPG